jgi:hypothetical protein
MMIAGKAAFTIMVLIVIARTIQTQRLHDTRFGREQTFFRSERAWLLMTWDVIREPRFVNRGLSLVMMRDRHGMIMRECGRSNHSPCQHKDTGKDHAADHKLRIKR